MKIFKSIPKNNCYTFDKVRIKISNMSMTELELEANFVLFSWPEVTVWGILI